MSELHPSAPPTHRDPAAPAYIPPFPARPEKRLPPWKLLAAARRNLIAIWPAATFSLNFFGYTLFHRGIFICNSPTTVRKVFIDDAENFTPKRRSCATPCVPWSATACLSATVNCALLPSPDRAPDPHFPAARTLVPRDHPSRRRDRARIWRGKVGTEIDALAEMAELGYQCDLLGDFRGSPGRRGGAQWPSFTDYQASIDQIDLPSLFACPISFPGFRISACAVAPSACGR